MNLVVAFDMHVGNAKVYIIISETIWDSCLPHGLASKIEFWNRRGSTQILPYFILISTRRPYHLPGLKLEYSLYYPKHSFTEKFFSFSNWLESGTSSSVSQRKPRNTGVNRYSVNCQSTNLLDSKFCRMTPAPHNASANRYINCTYATYVKAEFGLEVLLQLTEACTIYLKYRNTLLYTSQTYCLFVYCDN